MGDHGTAKYIQEVEDHNNIRTLVVGDLKKLGIKPPKTKKSKNRDENTDATNQTVFSNNLCNVPSLIVEGCGPVPRFLVEASEFLLDNVQIEGLFRKSGSVTRQKELKDKMELGERIQEDAHPYDVASLIKQFFRELPDALLTSKLHDCFLKCNQLEKEEERHSAIFLMCLLLPWHHLSTLRYFSQVLAQVASESEHNKMDVTNLALCLAPNLLHMNLKAEKMKDSESKLLQAQTSIVRLLIEHAEDIGMMNDTLYDQAMLMGSLCCFPSDDELEKSCDELDESQPTKGKKKKKKRSGSLQGLVSNLSSSFSKWRKDTKGHNSSSISDKSSMISIMSTDIPDASCVSEADCHVTLPSDYQTPKVMRKRKASADMLPFSATKKKAILQHMPQMSTLGTPYTPANRARQREASGHEFALGTPSIKFVDGASQLVFTATPGEGLAATPQRKMNRILTPSSGMKVKRHTAVKGCFSPKTPKSGKRRSMKGFFRRLSGTKESPGGLDTSDVVGKRLANTSACSMASKKKGGFFRRHKKTPSSPARLVTHLVPQPERLDDDSMSVASTSSLSSQDSQQSITSLDVQHREFPNHQRRYSGDSSPGSALRRGRPNTVNVGLREPNQRRSMEPGYVSSGPVRHSSQREIAMSASTTDCLDFSPVAFDTSPIPHKGNMQMLDCSPIGIAPMDDEDMEKTDLEISTRHQDDDTHQTSVMLQEDIAPTQNDVNMTHLESDHERAFIEESVCIEPSEEPKSGSNESKSPADDDVFKMPAPFAKPREAAPSAVFTESNVMDSSVNSDASDTSVITVIYNGQPVKSTYPCPKQPQRAQQDKPTLTESEVVTSSPVTTPTADGSNSTLGANESQLTEEELAEMADTVGEKMDTEGSSLNRSDSLRATRRESVLNLQKEQVGRVANTVTQFSAPDSDSTEVATKQDTALRFSNSVSRTRGSSPVRIPTIFAKADKEAAMYREITRNVMRTSMRGGGVKGKANLPISTSLVRSTSVENARKQLNSSSSEPSTPNNRQAGGTPESSTLDSMAGHTPIRPPVKPEFRAVEINESLLNTIDDVCTPKSEKATKDLRSPLTDSTNLESEAAPRIKQPMLVTDVGQRLLAKSLQYRINGGTGTSMSTPTRRGRLPIKSVKRLQGSPHSPLSPKSPKRYRQPKQPSPISNITKEMTF